MRFLVLSRNYALYSTARLIRSARARGHQVDVIDPIQLQLAVLPGRGAPPILHAGEPLARYDIVLPRIGASITRHGVSMVRRLVEMGTPVLNGPDAIALARDKVRSLEAVARARIRVPRTIATRTVAGVERALELVGGCPVVVKLQAGTQGVGTMLAETPQALFPLVETLWAMGQEVVLQEFIARARGRDVRAFVVGGKVVAAMRRTAPRGEFRSNLHRGAVGEKVTLTPRFRSAAVRAAKALALDVSGVDLLEDRDEPIVLEVNCSPGLEGIEQVTGIDIASRVITLAEARATE